MEIISPLTFLYVVFLSPFAHPSTLSTTQILFSSLWIVHYFYRATIYTYLAPNISPMHILTILCGILFNLFNAYTNAQWISLFSEYPNLGEKGVLRLLIGILIFFVGFFIHVYHDNLLFSLRAKSKDAAKRYSIPYGGLFRLISSPSYFGETIQWFGFAIATWYSPPATIFALAAPANLFPRAIATHSWYKAHFKDKYPKDRKSIIPFLL
ncbi:11185_t:CDS:1 [Ambispora gerdemannii]|uniref:11185_t:CDS:1 n=1 Tax=Ambispora gerdemannii TaxID=144530 RepID=A0A9N9CQ66_9GLOM|nr:11185_t:CDS:1 [Ambispora gerdemannii]